MALTVTERLRMSAGGKAWRMVEVVHGGGTASLTAYSVDLDYIEHIVGTVPKLSMVAASNLLDVFHMSISGDHSKIIWSSVPAVGTQDLTIVGW